MTQRASVLVLWWPAGSEQALCYIYIHKIHIVAYKKRL